MSFLPPAIFEIKAVADKAIAEFKQVNSELEKMEDQSQKAGGQIGGIDKASRIATAGLLAMGAAFVGFAAFGIKEANDSEQALNKLGQTMSNLGINSEANRTKIQALTDSYEKLGFGNEEAAAGFNKLLIATGSATTATNYLGLAADFARTKNISLEEASGALARASAGNAKAFKEMGISLDNTLPKSEAVKKAMAELNEKIGGQAVAYTDTFKGSLAVLKEEIANVAETIGATIMPYLKALVSGISDAIDFAKKHKTILGIVAGVVITLTAALAAYSITTKVVTAATKAWTVIQEIAKVATALMTGQQIALNEAMMLNPIGLVVAAVVLLIGGLVLLWNKSETFRKGVIAMAKAALYGFASIIPIVGQVGETILKFLLTPLKTLLGALSHLPGVGKYAKAGLDLLNKGLNGISDFADKAAAKAKTLADGLDKFNKPISIKFLKVEIPDLGDNSKDGKGNKGELTAEQKKAQEAVKKSNEDYMKIVKDFQDKISGAQSKFNDKMAKIDKDYAEETGKLNKDAQDKISKLNKDAAEKKLKAETETNKKIKEAQTRFNDEMGKLNIKKAEDLEKLTKDNQDKIASITLSGNEKLQSIIQQSVDRLRDAFAKGTEFSVTDLFKGLKESGSQNAESLLSAMKEKLAGAKQLAQNAAMLQAQGFSQTFIEQVVASGPEVGNQLAESLKNATPETISELKATFNDMENTQNSGLDALANEMNKGAHLATNELNKAYKEAQKDLAVALTDQAKQYAEAQAEINKTFNEASAEAEKTRDSAIASLKSDLAETIAEIDKNLQDSLNEVNKDLQEALNEAFKKFQDAQNDARKELADTLADIEADMVDKLGSITNATNSTIRAIEALAAALAAAKTFTAPTVSIPSTSTTPINTTTPTNTNTPTSVNTNTLAGINAASGVNITQNISYPNASASDISTKTISAIKFGAVNSPSYIGMMRGTE
jgi:hypothetical protein